MPVTDIKNPDQYASAIKSKLTIAEFSAGWSFNFCRLNLFLMINFVLYIIYIQ